MNSSNNSKTRIAITSHPGGKHAPGRLLFQKTRLRLMWLILTLVTVSLGAGGLAVALHAKSIPVLSGGTQLHDVSDVDIVPNPEDISTTYQKSYVISNADHPEVSVRDLTTNLIVNAIKLPLNSEPPNPWMHLYQIAVSTDGNHLYALHAANDAGNQISVFLITDGGLSLELTTGFKTLGYCPDENDVFLYPGPGSGVITLLNSRVEVLQDFSRTGPIGCRLNAKDGSIIQRYYSPPDYQDSGIPLTDLDSFHIIDTDALLNPERNELYIMAVSYQSRGKAGGTFVRSLSIINQDGTVKTVHSSPQRTDWCKATPSSLTLLGSGLYVVLDNGINRFDLDNLDTPPELTLATPLPETTCEIFAVVATRTDHLWIARRSEDLDTYSYYLVTTAQGNDRLSQVAAMTSAARTDQSASATTFRDRLAVGSTEYGRQVMVITPSATMSGPPSTQVIALSVISLFGMGAVLLVVALNHQHKRRSQTNENFAENPGATTGESTASKRPSHLKQLHSSTLPDRIQPPSSRVTKTLIIVSALAMTASSGVLITPLIGSLLAQQPTDDSNYNHFHGTVEHRPPTTGWQTDPQLINQRLGLAYTIDDNNGMSRLRLTDVTSGKVVHTVNNFAADIHAHPDTNIAMMALSGDGQHLYLLSTSALVVRFGLTEDGTPGDLELKFRAGLDCPVYKTVSQLYIDPDGSTITLLGHDRSVHIIDDDHNPNTWLGCRYDASSGELMAPIAWGPDKVTGIVTATLRDPLTGTIFILGGTDSPSPFLDALTTEEGQTRRLPQPAVETSFCPCDDSNTGMLAISGDSVYARMGEAIYRYSTRDLEAAPEMVWSESDSPGWKTTFFLPSSDDQHWWMIERATSSGPIDIPSSSHRISLLSYDFKHLVSIPYDQEPLEAIAATGQALLVRDSETPKSKPIRSSDYPLMITDSYANLSLVDAVTKRSLNDLWNWWAFGVAIACSLLLAISALRRSRRTQPALPADDDLVDGPQDDDDQSNATDVDNAMATTRIDDLARSATAQSPPAEPCDVGVEDG